MEGQRVVHFSVVYQQFRRTAYTVDGFRLSARHLRLTQRPIPPRAHQHCRRPQPLIAERSIAFQVFYEKKGGEDCSGAYR